MSSTLMNRILGRSSAASDMRLAASNIRQESRRIVCLSGVQAGMGEANFGGCPTVRRGQIDRGLIKRSGHMAAGSTTPRSGCRRFSTNLLSFFAGNAGVDFKRGHRVLKRSPDRWHSDGSATRALPSIEIFGQLKLLFVCVRIKANQNCLTPFDGGGSQISGGAEHQAN